MSCISTVWTFSQQFLVAVRRTVSSRQQYRPTAAAAAEVRRNSTMKDVALFVLPDLAWDRILCGSVVRTQRHVQTPLHSGPDGLWPCRSCMVSTSHFGGSDPVFHKTSVAHRLPRIPVTCQNLQIIWFSVILHLSISSSVTLNQMMWRFWQVSWSDIALSRSQTWSATSSRTTSATWIVRDRPSSLAGRKPASS